MAEEKSVIMTESAYERLKKSGKGLKESGKETAKEVGGDFLSGPGGGKGSKSLWMTVAGFGAGYWALQTDAVKNIQVFMQHWWLKAVLLAVAAYMLWKKKNGWWMVVAGLAATTFVQAYMAEQARKAAATPGAAPGTTAGIDPETGFPTYEMGPGNGNGAYSYNPPDPAFARKVGAAA